jgi:plastocyanin
MRITTLMTGLLAASLLGGCGGSTPTSPSGNPMPGTGGNGGYGGGGGPSPSSAAVTVGNVFFRSGRNGTVNPAVDTIAAGGTVTWTWGSNGAVSHSVQSQGSPGFTSSAIQTAAGSSYQVTFPAAGTYRYNCVVHGNSMTGTVVVQ